MYKGVAGFSFRGEDPKRNLPSYPPIYTVVIPSEQLGLQRPPSDLLFDGAEPTQNGRKFDLFSIIGLLLPKLCSPMRDGPVINSVSGGGWGRGREGRDALC